MNREKMRSEFEKHATRRGWSVYRTEAGYTDVLVDLCWATWIAACTACTLDITESLARLTADTAKELAQ